MTRRSKVAVVGAVAIALAVGVAYVERRAIAHEFLVAALAGQGVAPVALRVAEIGMGGFALRDVAIGAAAEPEISIAELEGAWSIASLRARRLDRLRVSGLRVRGDLGPLAPRDVGAAGAPLLPAPEIELRDARFSFATSGGPASGALDGKLSALADGAIAGRFELRLEHPLARASGSVAISGTLEAPAFDVALDGADGALHAEARGSADVPARSVQAKFWVAPIAFAPKGLQPSSLLPATGPAGAPPGIANAVGSVEARGTFTLDGANPELRLEIALRGIGFETAFARVAGVSGTVELRAPPLRTPAHQLVSIDRVQAGVTLRGGLVDFELLRDGVIAVESTTWSFAGGELRARGLALDPDAERTSATLEAHGLALAELLALAPLQGLEGTGRIDGELPLVGSGSEIRVTAGVLRARPEGGTLRYRPSEHARALAKSRPHDLGIAVAAFSDFRYETLEATVDGDLRGEVRVGLRVRGSSPKFQAGQPIELNLNLESRLANLVREGIAVYRVPDVVEERLRDFSEKGRP